ncbi:MAG: ATP-grasp domain-containing protein [Bacteriovoracaceae bacterium]
MSKALKTILILFNQEHLSPNTTINDSDHGTTARESVVKMAHTVGDALKSMEKYQLFYLGICEESSLTNFLDKNKIDLVFNLTESTTDNPFFEIEITELLQKRKIALTGNSAETLKRAMNKAECTKYMAKCGIPVPCSLMIKNLSELSDKKLKFPMIVKPNFEDGSTGIEKSNVVKSIDELKAVAQKFLDNNRPLIIQEFIEGRELNAAIIESHPVKLFGISEIDFSIIKNPLEQILSYSAKWDTQSYEYDKVVSKEVKLSPELYEKISTITFKVCSAINLHNYARIDFRLDVNENLYVIDINPNCDLSTDAGLALIAARKKVAYRDLIEKIALDAYIHHSKGD